MFSLLQNIFYFTLNRISQGVFKYCLKTLTVMKFLQEQFLRQREGMLLYIIYFNAICATMQKLS